MQAEKSIAQHTDMSSIVWILIGNGKLANHQISKLVAIGVHVKTEFVTWELK